MLIKSKLKHVIYNNIMYLGRAFEDLLEIFSRIRVFLLHPAALIKAVKYISYTVFSSNKHIHVPVPNTFAPPPPTRLKTNEQH